ncbi:MAG TPA: hypothetical protein VF240_14045 [Pyrinomonadaceae bacterium]
MPDKDQIKTVGVEALWRRVLVVLPALAVLFASWTAARWCMGSTLASNPPAVESVIAAARVRPNDPQVQEALAQIGGILHAAERWAPDDPQVHYTLGVFARKSFAPEELREVLVRYERAVSLAPHDHRLWMELGRARGQAGDEEGGALALRHAVSLAPHYSMPRWYLGNLLLRAGREPEAFAELRRAAEIDPTLHTQIFTTAWSYFGGDVRAVGAAVGDSYEARARLVQHLLTQKRLDEALILWGTLKTEERREQAASGASLMNALIEAGRYRKALEVYGEVQPAAAQDVAVGKLFNGGFERDVTANSGNPFDWIVRPVPQAQMNIDARNAREGRRSLRLEFSAPSEFTLGQFSQLVLVEPRARYRLSYAVRTEEVKSAATLVVQVTDAAGVAFAGGAAAPAGTSDWQQVIVEFTAPAAEAVTLRLVRVGCSDGACPIFGKVWYDDFNLQRVGGSAAAGAPAPKGQ